MPEISVIIPMFNAELFIVPCIQSVMSQTYDNFEVIVVDDGSRDNCRKLCEEMREKDKRICLVTQEHKGVSAARNRGIMEAKGKYVFFLDSDDTIHPQLIEALYASLEEKGAGIATENYCYIDSESKRVVDWEASDIHSKDTVYLSNEKAVEHFVWEDGEGKLQAIGGKMIRRTLLDSLLFKKELINGEDTLFLYQLLRRGADIVILKRAWYCYRKHGKGSSQIYTILTCQSRYKVACRICNYEIKSGRALNARHLKMVMLNMMLRWYNIGKKRHDEKLVKYIKALASAEKRADVFSWIGTREKIKFYPLFGGYVIKRLFKMRDIYRGWVIVHPRIRRGLRIIRKRLKMTVFYNRDFYGKAGN